MRFHRQNPHFPRSQIDPEGFTDEQESADFRVIDVGIGSGMQNDPVIRGLGTDVTAARVVE